jgi:predicted alpha/beta-hydrolase family hydrolase
MDEAVAAQEIEMLPLGLKGSLAVPNRATGIVLFAHGSGSSRLSPRNAQVARALNDAGLATLLCDLLLRGEAPSQGVRHSPAGRPPQGGAGLD